MDWKLDQIFVRDRINQSELSRVLVEQRWWPGKSSGVLAKINDHTHNVDAFLRRRDVVRWYEMYRSYLNVSPIELTGCKTDEDAIATILQSKLQLKLEDQGIDIKVKVLEIDPIEPIQSVPAEVLDLYIGKGYTLNGIVDTQGKEL